MRGGIGIERRGSVWWLVLAFGATLAAFSIQTTEHELADGKAVGEHADQEAPTAAAAVLGFQVIEQANALRDAGDAEGAVALLRDYAPQVAMLQAIKRMTLASAYSDMEDWESALAQYAGVVEMEGVLPPGRVANASLLAGHRCLMLDRYDDAVKYLETWKRVTAEPQAGVYAELARAYTELGQHALAIENLEEGLRLAEEQARTADEDPNVVMYFRQALAEARRLAAEQ